MNNIMVDIETLDTKPGAVIISIAAVSFNTIILYKTIEDFKNDLLSSKIFVEIDIDDSLKKGYTISRSTIQFWFEKDFNPLGNFQIASVNEALDWLACFIKGFENPILWANGITFDGSILEAMYLKERLKIPWKYNAWRDSRTLFRLANKEIAEITIMGTPHNPLHDCYNQIAKLNSILKYHKLNELP